MAFKRFTGTLPRAGVPRVSVRRRGKLGFNMAAVKKYGIADYSHVVLYYDKSIDSVGVEFTNDANTEGALRVNKPKTGDVYVCALSFFRHFKIPIGITKRAKFLKTDDKRSFFAFIVPVQDKSKKSRK